MIPHQPCRFCMHWSGHDKDGRFVSGYTCSGLCKAIEAERQGDHDALRREIDKLAPMGAFAEFTGQKH